MARKRKHEEHENHERWLVSYADFITLLFAFFVVMYAISTKDLEKSKEFQESIRKYFNMQASMMSGGGGGGAGANKLSVDEALKDEFPGLKAGPVEISDHIQRSLEKKLGSDSLKNKGIAVQHDAIGTRINLAASALFQQGSARLKPESLEILDKIGETLKRAEHKIIIEGHTDNTQLKSELYPSNWELGAARASVIVRYLIKRHGLQANKMVALSYADQKPISENETEEGRAKNRRVEILIVSSESYEEAE
jgi:chemotaxis protein MotB